MQSNEVMERFKEQRTKAVAKEIKDWREVQAAVALLDFELPEPSRISFSTSGITLQYPMDKKIIGEHIEYFAKLGFEVTWLANMTESFPTTKFVRGNLVIRITYNSYITGTTCVAKVISREIKTYESTTVEWVCPEAVEEKEEA